MLEIKEQLGQAQSSNCLLELRNIFFKYIILSLALSLVFLFYHHRIIECILFLLKTQFYDLKLVNFEVTRPFSLVLSLVFFLSLLILMPFFLYSLWSFIAPGLYAREKKILRFHLLFTFSCIVLLQLFSCFIVVPAALKFFLAFNGQYFEQTLTLLSLIDFMMVMQKGFFLCSCLPPLLSLLLHFQMISFYRVQRARPYLYVLCFTLAMLLTPPDVISQVLMAIPLIGLFELTLWILKRPELAKVC